MGDLVCLSGVVMLAVTFFQRVGRAPTADNKASSAALLQELGIQNTAGAPLFTKQTLADWQEQFSSHGIFFSEALVAQTGFTAQDANKITLKLHELDDSMEIFKEA